MRIRGVFRVSMVVAALAAPPLAHAASFTAVSPAGASTVSIEPLFQLQGTDVPTNEPVGVRISSSPAIDGAGVLQTELPGASPLTLWSESPLSSTWSARVARPMAPGVYYWQFLYRDLAPCVVDPTADPSTWPCSPPANATCGDGRCVSEVMTFTVAADTTAPQISALGAKVKLGPSRLTFAIVEANIARVTLTVGFHGTVTTVQLLPVYFDPASTYFTPWTPQRRGNYRFCASAVDESHNASPKSCRTIRVV